MQIKTNLVGCSQINFFSIHTSGAEKVRKKKKIIKRCKTHYTCFQSNKHLRRDEKSCLLFSFTMCFLY